MAFYDPPKSSLGRRRVAANPLPIPPPEQANSSFRADKSPLLTKLFPEAARSASDNESNWQAQEMQRQREQQAQLEQRTREKIARREAELKARKEADEEAKARAAEEKALAKQAEDDRKAKEKEALIAENTAFETKARAAGLGSDLYKADDNRWRLPYGEEEMQARSELNKRAAEEEAKKKAIDAEIASLSAEKGIKPYVTVEETKQAEKDLEEIFPVARSKALGSIDAKAQEFEKRGKSFFGLGGDPVAAKEAEKLKAKYEGLISDPNGLDEEELNAADPVTAARYKTAKEKLEATKQAKAWHDAMETKISMLKLKRDSQAKWEELQAKELANAPDADLGKMADEIKATDAGTTAQAQEREKLLQQNREKLSAGVAPGETVTTADGQVVHKDLAPELEKLTPTKDPDADVKRKLIADEIQRRIAINDTKVKEYYARLRSSPLYADIADKYEALDAEQATRLKEVDDKASDPAQYKEMRGIVIDDIRNKRNAIEEAKAGRIEIEKKIFALADQYMQDYDVTLNAGLGRGDNTKIELEKAKEIISRLKERHDKSRDKLAKELGIDTITAYKASEDYIQASKPWLDVGIDGSRILPSGAVMVNPKAIWDTGALEKAKEFVTRNFSAIGKDPVKGAEMVDKQVADMRERSSHEVFADLMDAPVFQKWLEKNKLPGDKGMTGEQKAGLILKFNQDKTWWDRLSNDAKQGLYAGLTDLQQGAWSISTAGSDGLYAATGLQYFRDIADGKRSVAEMYGRDVESLSRSRTAVGKFDLIPGISVGDVAQAAPSIAVSMLPGVALARLSQAKKLGVLTKILTGAKNEMTAEKALQVAGVAGMRGATAGAFVQSFASSYGQARSGFMAQGMSRDEAEQQALWSATKAGLSTAALTRLFGLHGAEAALGSNPTMREMFKVIGKDGLRNSLKSPKFRKLFADSLGDLGMEAISEVPEESMDQFVQGLMEKASYNPDKTWKEVFDETMNAGGVALFLGGAGPLVAGAKGMAADATEKILAKGQSNPATPAANPATPAIPAPNTPAATPENIVKATSDIANAPPPADAADTGIDWPATQTAATAIVQIGTGNIAALSDDELKSVGLTRNDKGVIEQSQPGKDSPAPLVKMENGEPIILDAGTALLEQHFPDARQLIAQTEGERRAEIEAQQQQDQQTTTEDPSTPEAPTSDTPQPTDAGATESPPSDTATAAPPGTGPAGVDTNSLPDYEQQIVSILEESYGFPSDDAKAIAKDHLARRGVTKTDANGVPDAQMQVLEDVESELGQAGIQDVTEKTDGISKRYLKRFAKDRKAAETARATANEQRASALAYRLGSEDARVGLRSGEGKIAVRKWVRNNPVPLDANGNPDVDADFKAFRESIAAYDIPTGPSNPIRQKTPSEERAEQAKAKAASTAELDPESKVRALLKENPKATMAELQAVAPGQTKAWYADQKKAAIPKVDAEVSTKEGKTPGGQASKTASKATLPRNISTAVGKLPDALRPKALKLLKPLLETLRKYESVEIFSDIRFVDEFPAGTGGMRLAPDGALEIHLPTVANDSIKRIRAALSEEAIHAIAVRVIDKAQVVSLWNSLPRELQQAVRKVYFASYEVNGETLPEGDAFSMGHEAIRMMVQDKAFLGRITEAQGLAGKVKAILETLLSELRRMIDAAPAEAKRELEAARDSVISALEEVGIIESRAIAESAPANESPATRELSRRENAANKLRSMMGLPPLNASAKATADDDARYLELAKDPKANRDTLQAMVDESAKAAGYGGLFFHGTNAVFNTFSVTSPPNRVHGHPSRVMGAFLTNRKDSASSYALTAAGKIGGTPRVIRAFVRLKNPKEFTIREFYNRYDGFQKNDWKRKEAIAKRDAEAFQKDGFDGISVGDGFEVAIFNPNQIKSADPVTYDETGNVIPLSQRFNPDSNSILYAPAKPSQEAPKTVLNASAKVTAEDDARYLELAKDPKANRDALQSMVDKAAKAAGYDSPKVYHGTQRQFNVFDINRSGERTDSGVAGRGFYFTAKKSEAQSYANRKSEIGGRVVSAYLKLGNQHKTGNLPDIEVPSKTLEDLMNGPAEYSKRLTDWMIANGYQSVEFNGHIVVFNPNQIKSADPVTYDETGNVIPLSQRFNPDSNSILYAPAKPSQEAPKTVRELLKKHQLVRDSEVLAVLGDYPAYLDEVSSFILNQRQKWLDGKLTARDVAKAYVMTVASQGADAVNLETIQSKLPWFNPGPDYLNVSKTGQRNIRPEEAAAYWLFTPRGQAALDAIEQGIVDDEAWSELSELRKIYGDDRMFNTGITATPEGREVPVYKKDPRDSTKKRLLRDLDGNPIQDTNDDGSPKTRTIKLDPKTQNNLTNISRIVEDLNSGPKTQAGMEKAVLRLRGIGDAKKAFIGHLLGLGSGLTTDAVEINFWITGQGDTSTLGTGIDKAKSVKKYEDYLRSLAKAVSKDQVAQGELSDRIKRSFRRLRAKNPQIAAIPEDIFNHIMHHWLWDRAKGIETTHKGMMAAQSLAAGEKPTEPAIDYKSAEFRNVASELGNSLYEAGFTDPMAFASELNTLLDGNGDARLFGRIWTESEGYNPDDDQPKWGQLLAEIRKPVATDEPSPAKAEAPTDSLPADGSTPGGVDQPVAKKTKARTIPTVKSKASEIIRSGMFETISALADIKIAPPSPAIPLIRSREKRGMKLSELEMKLLRDNRDYDGYPSQKSVMDRGDGGKVAAEILSRIMSGKERPDNAADFWRQGSKPSEMWDALVEELYAVAEGRGTAMDAARDSYEEGKVNEMEAQLDRFEAANRPAPGRTEIDAKTLTVGDKLVVDGEILTVSSLEMNQETGEADTVILDDHYRFGRQFLEGGDSVFVEEAWSGEGWNNYENAPNEAPQTQPAPEVGPADTQTTPISQKEAAALITKDRAKQILADSNIKDRPIRTYEQAVAANQDHMGTKISDWNAFPFNGDISSEGRPLQDLSGRDKDFTKAPTLFPSGQFAPNCEWCGHQPVKNFYFIEHPEKKWTLAVGSECIAHFSNLSGDELGSQAAEGKARMLISGIQEQSRTLSREFLYTTTDSYGRSTSKWMLTEAKPIYEKLNATKGKIDKDSTKGTLMRWLKAKGTDAELLAVQYAELMGSDQAKSIMIKSRQSKLSSLEDKIGSKQYRDGPRFGPTKIYNYTETQIENFSKAAAKLKAEISGLSGEAVVAQSTTGQELFQSNEMPFNLVAETAEDIRKREEAEIKAENERKAKEAAAAKAENDRLQGNLFDQSPVAERIDTARADVDQSPTDAQKEAGNYRKGHVSIQGLAITIENPKGSVRSGTDEDGKAWTVEMKNDYGYLKRTEGKDGDQVDVFIGPDPESPRVFVVNQLRQKPGSPPNGFDEHKVMIGFPDQASAVEGYLGNYSPGWRVGPVAEMTMDEFKDWIANGDTSKPVKQAQSDKGSSKDIPKRKPKEKKVPVIDRLRNYFAPGRVIPTWSGFDRVIKFNASGEFGEDWSVIVQGVIPADGRTTNGITRQRISEIQWINDPNDRPRTHKTPPTEQEFRASEALFGDVPTTSTEQEINPAIADTRDDEAKMRDFLKENPNATMTEMVAVVPDQLKSWYAKQRQAARDLESRPQTSAESETNAQLAQKALDPVAANTDFGEKIGGARKDLAIATGGSTTKKIASSDTVPKWQKGYAIVQVMSDRRNPENAGRWTFQKTAEKPSFGGWNNAPVFNTEEEAKLALPAWIVTKKHRVMSASGNGDKYAIRRIVTDRKSVEIKTGFDTREEASKYLIDNALEILNTKTGFGEEILSPREDQKIYRKGTDRRTTNATQQMFMDTFAPRGVEFGNWITTDEGQEVLNHAYDGLLDLADVIGVPPKALFLNGDLALAFGARGQGLSGARAHYEPDRVVINLTKMSGAGSLAHEWMHAVDHYFARQEGRTRADWATNSDGTRSLMVKGTPETKNNIYVSSGKYQEKSGMREEVSKAWENFRQTMLKKTVQRDVDVAKLKKWQDRAAENLKDTLGRIRQYLATEQTYGTRKAPATADQLSRWDQAVEKLTSGNAGPLEWKMPKSIKQKLDQEDAKRDKAKKAGKFVGRSSVSFKHMWLNDAFEELSDIHKEVRNRSGLSGEKPVLDMAIFSYKDLLKRKSEFEMKEATATESASVPTDFVREAYLGDLGRVKDYWQEPWELAARAFSSYIEDKVKEKGAKSGFLSTGSSESDNIFFKMMYGFMPYPSGSERAEINKSLDNLFGTLQTKETDRGVALYSSPPVPQPGGNTTSGPGQHPLRAFVEPEGTDWGLYGRKVSKPGKDSWTTAERDAVAKTFDAAGIKPIMISPTTGQPIDDSFIISSADQKQLIAALLERRRDRQAKAKANGATQQKIDDFVEKAHKAQRGIGWALAKVVAAPARLISWAMPKGVAKALDVVGNNNIDKAFVSAIERAATGVASTDVAKGVAKAMNSLAGTKGGQVTAEIAQNLIHWAKKNFIPQSLWGKEFAAKIREMNVTKQFMTETSMDVIRALKGTEKFTDLMMPERWRTDTAMHERIWRVLDGQADVATLPKELHHTVKTLRELSRKAGLEAVRTGRMSLETFRAMDKEGYVTHYYDNDSEGIIDKIVRRVPVLKNQGYVHARRMEAWRIEDTQTKDPNAPNLNALVNFQPGKFRFSSKAHRDAFYEQFLREQVVETIKKSRPKGLSGSANQAISTLTPAQLLRLERLPADLRGYISRISEQQRGRWIKKRPLTQEEKEKAGLIMDPFYATARHILQMGHDNATAKFFNEVVKLPDVVSSTDIAGFKKIADDARFGALRGKYVREDLHEQLQEIANVNDSVMRIADNMLTLWKTGKTVLNPSTHFRNIMGNVAFSGLAGNNVLNPAKWENYRRSIRAIRDGGTDLKLLIENGITGNDFASAELAQALKRMLPNADLVDTEKGPMETIGMFLKGALNAGLGKAFDLYGIEDDFYKAATFFKYLQDGKTAEEAATETRKWFPYYDQIGTSGALKWTRRVVPFFSFQREALRIMGNAAKERPLMLTAQLSMFWGLTQLSMMALGLRDEDKEDVEKELRGHLKFSDAPVFSMLLPWRDSEGRLQQWDMSNVMPFANFLGRNVGFDRSEDPASSELLKLLTAQNPFVSLMTSHISNKDAYTGKPIWEDSMTPEEKRGKAFGHAWNVLVPPLMGTSLDVLKNAGTRTTNKSLETRNTPQAWARSIAGFDIRNASPDFYDAVDKYMTKHEMPGKPGGQWSSTPEYRARAELWGQLVQDEPDYRKAGALLKYLKTEHQETFDTPKSLSGLLDTRNPLKALGADEKRKMTAAEVKADFLSSLSGETGDAVRKSLAEFERIKMQAPARLEKAKAFMK